MSRNGLMRSEQSVFLDDSDDARGRERDTQILIDQREQALSPEGLNTSMAGLRSRRWSECIKCCPDTSSLKRCLGSLRSSVIMTTFTWKRPVRCNSM
jgi:hypothetical protein